MSLFRELGRQVEQLKTKATDATGSDVAAECEACGARLAEHSEYCPECGSDDVVAVDGGEDDHEGANAE